MRIVVDKVGNVKKFQMENTMWRRLKTFHFLHMSKRESGREERVSTVDSHIFQIQHDGMQENNEMTINYSISLLNYVNIVLG